MDGNAYKRLTIVISNKIRQPRVCEEKCPSKAEPVAETEDIVQNTQEVIEEEAIEELAVDIINGTGNGTDYDLGNLTQAANETVDYEEVDQVIEPELAQEDIEEATVDAPLDPDDRCNSPWNTCRVYSDSVYDFTFVEKVQTFARALSKAIFVASRGHFYIASVTIVLPANWIPPPDGSPVKEGVRITFMRLFMSWTLMICISQGPVNEKTKHGTHVSRVFLPIDRSPFK